MNSIHGVLERIKTIQSRVKEIQPMRVKEISNQLTSIQGKKFNDIMNKAISPDNKNETIQESKATKDNNGVTPHRSSSEKTQHGVTDLKAIIQKAGAKYNVPEKLINSVIRTESAFNPKAVSKAGAMGLMQLMPQTAKEYGVTDAFDPKQNIFAGTKHLRGLMDRFKGDLPLSLAAYNAGARRVIESNGIPDIRETKNYVKSVINHYQKIKNLK